MKLKGKIVPVVAACCAAVLLATGLGAPGLPAPPGREDETVEAGEVFENFVAPSAGLAIQAAATDGNGCIAADPAFLLTLSKPMDGDYIAAWLAASPKFEYELEQTGKLEYRLTPKAALDRNTLYTLSFDPLQAEHGLPARAGNSWAFQTQKGFAVERTFPANEGTGVPVNSVIELTFTGDVDIEQLKRHISFSPTLEGDDWSREGMNTYRFMADGGGMLEGTQYEVRVKGALTDSLGKQSLGKDFAFKFETEAKEEEEAGERFWGYVENENNAFMSSEKPAFALHYDTDDADSKLGAAVYRFGSMEAYAQALNARLGYDEWSRQGRPEIDTGKLSKVFGGKVGVMTSGWTKIAILPDQLPKGFYLAEFTVGENTLTSLFQVSDMSAYAMYGGGDCLFWVNDLITSLPVAGAEIAPAGGAVKGRTDARGILETKHTDGYTVFSVRKGGDCLLVTGGDSPGEGGFSRMDYWRYLYLDKELYTPSDTVNFFGVVSPKQAGTQALGKVTAVLETGYWDDEYGGGDGGESEIRMDVSVKNGVYEGKLKLPELPPGYYHLSVYYDKQRLSSSGISVEIYEKPAYSFTLSTDKRMVWTGEEVEVSAAAEYFDGTPVAGLDVEIDGKDLRTDASGRAGAKVRAGFENDRLMSYNHVYVNAQLPEIGDVNEDTYFKVMNSDVEIETRSKWKDGAASLEVQAFAVDFSEMDLEDSGRWHDTSAYLKDFKGNLKLTVEWTKITYVKKDIPSSERVKRYDPYTKTYTEEVYTYERVEKKVAKGKGLSVTVTGKAKQSFALPFDADAEYRIEISGKDSKGRQFVRSEYLYTNTQRYSYDEDYEYGYGEKYIYLRDSGGEDGLRYAVGDKVSLSIYESYYANDPIQPDKGAILFVRAGDRYIDCAVPKGNLFEFTFDGSVLPNVNVYAVQFSGREYIEASMRYLAALDEESRALTVGIKPDKDSYKPGDTAKLSLKLTGPGGQPVKGTVNLNMVDEALLSMQEQYVDISGEIFGDHYYFYHSTTISHVVVRGSDGGECGDEGGSRSDFRDTALFRTIETDDAGQAALEVKLPDNITSWRVFWQAFRPGGEAMAGSGRANIIATLPFFIDIRLTETFLTGDRPTLGVRCAGQALDGGKANCTVEIPSLGFSRTESAPLTGWLEIPLPALTKGEHKITVSGEYNGHRDAITKTLVVADGIADHMQSETSLLSEATAFHTPARGLARLVFSDRQKAQVMRGLGRLLYTGSIRAEQVLARRAAEEILAEALPDRTSFSGTDTGEKIAQYQKSNGAIAPFTYASPDDPLTLETTVWACAAASDCFNSAAAADYLYGELAWARKKGEGGRAVLALAGLAALKEPVMQYLSEYMREDLLTEDRITLALAQVFIGNGGAAKALVGGILSNDCSKPGVSMHVTGGGDDQIIKNTANLAVAAVSLDLPEGGPLFQYILNYVHEGSGVEDPCLLQQAMVLRHKARSVNPKCASFSYTLGGETKQVQLFICRSLMLTAQQLWDIRFSNISDEIEVTVSTVADGFPAGSSDLLSVSQKYGKAELAQNATAFCAIGYKINRDAPDGYYEIVHILPAGLEFTGVDYRPLDGWWLSEVKGKQVTFTVYKGKGAESGTIRFNARITMTGSFRSEGTYILNPTRPEAANQTKGGVVVIK